MKNAISIGIVVVLLLLLVTRPAALTKLMHHGELKALCLGLVILATVRETCIGVLAAVVFIVLSENIHEGFDEENKSGLLQAIKNDVGKSLIDDDDDDDDDADDDDDDHDNGNDHDNGHDRDDGHDKTDKKKKKKA